MFAVGPAALVSNARIPVPVPTAIEYADLDALSAAHEQSAIEPMPSAAPPSRPHRLRPDPRGTELYLWSEK